MIVRCRRCLRLMDHLCGSDVCGDCAHQEEVELRSWIEHLAETDMLREECEEEE